MPYDSRVLSNFLGRQLTRGSRSDPKHIFTCHMSEKVRYEGESAMLFYQIQPGMFEFSCYAPVRVTKFAILPSAAEAAASDPFAVE